MKKRILSLFTAVCISASLLAALPVSAYDMGKVGVNQTISTGDSHTAAIKTDGSLWAWGNNPWGQLGDGTNEDKSTPVKIMDNVASVSVGEFNTAIIKTDGTLWTCGDNMYGQVGNKEVFDAVTPIKIMDNVAAVSVGYGHMMAITTDGSLWAWGDNEHGQLGDGTNESRYSPVKIMDNVAAVSAGFENTAAIKTDGTLWTWGDNECGQLGDGTNEAKNTPVKIMDNVDSVSAGLYKNMAAVKTDGSLWVWGNNSAAQLGIGTTENKSTPIQVMDNTETVSVGFSHTSAIKTDGSLWGWGSNFDGELGIEDGEYVDVPTKTMDNVAYVSSGDSYTAVIKTGGILWTYGDNFYGQLGFITAGTKSEPAVLMDGVMVPTESQVSDTPANETPAVSGETSFGAKVSDWAAAELELAYANNLIPEAMTNIDLTQKVNRGEFAAIALKLYDVLSNTQTPLPADCPFVDIAGDPNEDAIKKASSLDITNGTSDTTFEPSSFITREQLATMLCRVIKKHNFDGWTLATDANYPMNTEGAVPFADDKDISDWARASVYYMSLHGIIKGVDETHFAPKNTTAQQEESGYASATREQAIIMAQRIFNNADALV